MIIYKEVTNLRLCHRKCLVETIFRCRSIEYDRHNQWCRLYRNTREVKSSKISLEAAMNGKIFGQSQEQQSITQSQREERERRDKINRLQRSITEHMRQKQRLIDLGLAKQQADTISLYDDRIKEDKEKLEKMSELYAIIAANPKISVFPCNQVFPRAF